MSDSLIVVCTRAGLNHRWDIVIETQRVLIEVDGCYWHNCPVCMLRGAYTRKNDIHETAYATVAGWTVIRIRECEIKAGDFSKLFLRRQQCSQSYSPC